MATDTNVILGARVPRENFFNSFLQGVDYRNNREDRARAKELQPMQDQILQQQIEAGQLATETGRIDNETAERSALIAKARQQNAHARRLLESPRDQRRSIHDKHEKITGTADDVIDPVEDDEFLFQVIAATDSVLAQQEMTTGMQDALFAAGGDPVKARKIMTERLTKPNSQVTIENTPGVGEFAKGLARSDATYFGNLQETATIASDLVEQLQVARSIDVTTNPGESMKLAAREMGAAFGFPVDEDKINSAQAYQAVLQGIVNQRLTQEKGPQTDQDVERFKLQFGRLDNPEDAKNFLLSYAESLQERKIEQAEFFDTWRINNPEARDLTSARRAWRDQIRQNPIISKAPSPATGLPVFYYDYERQMRAANPTMTDKDIETRWRQINQ